MGSNQFNVDGATVVTVLCQVRELIKPKS